MANVENLEIKISINDEATAKLDEIKRKIEEIGEISSKGNFQHLKEVASSIKSMAGSAEKLNNTVSAIQKLSSSMDGLTKSMGGMKSNSFSNATKNVRQMGKAVADFNSQAGSGTKGIAFNIIGADAAKSLANDFRFAWTEGKKLASIPFKMMFSPLKGVAGMVQNVSNGFSRLLHTIGRVAFMRAIRGAIRMMTQSLKEGVKAVYEWAGVAGNSFVGTMDRMATSLTYFRNSIGAALSPLLDAIAPVLDAIIDKCVAVINVFNQMIAVLTGATTWRRAEKVATSYGGAVNNAAKGTKAANNAAKELKRTLLGFDEINKLDDANSGSGSGGSGGGGGGSSGAGALVFSNQQIGQDVSDFVEKLKKAWEKADFTEIGEIIGTKIGNALLSVPWATKIQPTVKKLAKSFGTLLNGMFDYNGSGGKKMWDGIAYTAYNALNTALLGYITFFNTVHWEGIGQGIGSALYTTLANIRWDWVSDALAAFPNAVIKAVKGFNEKFTPEKFRSIGVKFGGAVADAIIKIEWGDFFKDATGLAERLLKFLNGALESFGARWGNIRKGIVGGIEKVSPETWRNIGTELGKLVFNVANFAANVVATLIEVLENADWDEIWEGFKEGLGRCDWDGLRDKICGFIEDHLSTVSIILALAIGSVALKTGITLLRHMVITAPLSGGAGLTLAKWASGLTMVAALLLSFVELKNTVDKSGINSDAFKRQLGSGIAAAVVGLAFFGLTGAALGFLIGVHLNLDVKKMTTNVVAKIVKIKDDLLKSLPGWFKDLLGWDTDTTKQTPSELWGHASSISAPNSTTKVIESPTDKLKTKITSVFSNVLQTLSQFSLGGNVYAAEVLNKTTNTGGVTNLTPPSGTITDIYTPQGEHYTVDITGKLVKVEDNLTDSQKTSNKWTAIYDFFKGLGVTGTTIDNWQANYTKGFMGLGVIGAVIAGFTADYSRGMKGIGVVGKVISKFIAEYTGRQQKNKVLSGSIISNFVAEYTKRQQKNKVLLGSIISNFTAEIEKRKLPPASDIVFWLIKGFIAGISGNKKTSGSDAGTTGGATGGIYKNGRWYPVQNYASGGILGTTGQMFIAREAGPELVGTIGGNTAIMNNDQIVSSVSAGVARAVAGVLGGQGSNPIEVTVKVDSEVLYRAVRKGERKANGRYGTAVAVG